MRLNFVFMNEYTSQGHSFLSSYIVLFMFIRSNAYSPLYQFWLMFTIRVAAFNKVYNFIHTCGGSLPPADLKALISYIISSDWHRLVIHYFTTYLLLFFPQVLFSSEYKSFRLALYYMSLYIFTWSPAAWSFVIFSLLVFSSSAVQYVRLCTHNDVDAGVHTKMFYMSCVCVYFHRCVDDATRRRTRHVSQMIDMGKGLLA